MQAVCLSFYSFSGRADRWWAFTQMGLAPAELQQVMGLDFFRMMGTGAGMGFRPWPDTGTYALLTVWKDTDSAEHALKESSIFQQLESRSSGIKSYWLRAHRGKGAWKGDQPFVLDPEPIVGKVAVITRARIKWNWMPYFWLRVRKVSRQLKGLSELEFSKGIGEWPLIEQATFSLWTSESAIDAYAYRGKRHRKVVQATRKTGWYSEEMFMRFHVLAEQNGTPLPIS